MITELNIENINELDGSFIDKEYIEKELSLNPYGKVLLLEESGSIIGYLYYSDIYERAEINQIEVKEDKRKMGKGTMLMDYLVNKVNKDITLEVKIDNAPALKLYEKYGFEKVAVRKGYYSGVDGLLMIRHQETP